jgi:hypothetical protein
LFSFSSVSYIDNIKNLLSIFACYVCQVVRWGRSVYANIQKFIQFQLTVNVTALVINFVASISSGNVPLTAVQVALPSQVRTIISPNDNAVHRSSILILRFLRKFHVAASVGQSHHGHTGSSCLGNRSTNG